jgi:hypothetical protein
VPERTLAWLRLSRRFSKDYERLPEMPTPRRHLLLSCAAGTLSSASLLFREPVHSLLVDPKAAIYYGGNICAGRCNNIEIPAWSTDYICSSTDEPLNYPLYGSGASSWKK